MSIFHRLFGRTTPKASGASRSWYVSRRACDYDIGERVVLTLPLSNSYGKIPAGTVAKVLDRSTDPTDNSVTLGFDGFKDLCDYMETSSLKIESLERGEGAKYLPTNTHGIIPLRRTADGWIVSGRQLRARLRDGRTIEGQNLGGSCSRRGSLKEMETVKIGTVRFKEGSPIGENIGTEYHMDEIVELWWLQ